MTEHLQEIIHKLDNLKDPTWLSIFKNSIGAIIIGSVSLLTIIVNNLLKEKRISKERQQNIYDDIKENIEVLYKSYKVIFNIIKNRTRFAIEAPDRQKKLTEIENLKNEHNDFVKEKVNIFHKMRVNLDIVNTPHIISMLDILYKKLDHLTDYCSGDLMVNILSEDLKKANNELTTINNDIDSELKILIKDFSKLYRKKILKIK